MWTEPHTGLDIEEIVHSTEVKPCLILLTVGLSCFRRGFSEFHYCQECLAVTWPGLRPNTNTNPGAATCSKLCGPNILLVWNSIHLSPDLWIFIAQVTQSTSDRNLAGWNVGRKQARISAWAAHTVLQMLPHNQNCPPFCEKLQYIFLIEIETVN